VQQIMLSLQSPKEDASSSTPTVWSGRKQAPAKAFETSRRLILEKREAQRRMSSVLLETGTVGR
jgi:hypothetical protein